MVVEFLLSPRVEEYPLTPTQQLDERLAEHFEVDMVSTPPEVKTEAKAKPDAKSKAKPMRPSTPESRKSKAASAESPTKKSKVKHQKSLKQILEEQGDFYTPIHNERYE